MWCLGACHSGGPGLGVLGNCGEALWVLGDLPAVSRQLRGLGDSKSKINKSLVIRLVFDVSGRFMSRLVLAPWVHECSNSLCLKQLL